MADIKNARKSDYAIIVGIAASFLFIIALGLHSIFQTSSEQTRAMEQMRLDSIRDDFRSSLSDAENLTSQIALATDHMLANNYSDDELIDFFDQQIGSQKQISHIECTQIYMIDQNLNSVPYFDFPNSFRIISTVMYRVAAKDHDTIYIFEPSIDPSTGEMEFTMAKLLSDNQSVVVLNFKLVEMQEIIARMTSVKDSVAFIATENGMIIAHSDSSLAGGRILQNLPEYESVLERASDSQHCRSFQTEIDGSSRTIFSSEIREDWYMISSVKTFDLYRDIYLQIAAIATIALILLAGLIYLYLLRIKNRLQSEQSVHAQEEFLNRLTGDLRAPLMKILRISSIGTLSDSKNFSESAEQVRDSALQLASKLENILSFSNIVSTKEEKSDSSRILQLSQISRTARTGIVGVLIIALGISLTVCLSTTMDLGDTKMNHDADSYNDQVSNWFTRRQTIIGMFVDTISERPNFVQNYSYAVDFLKDISRRYPEIYVCYIANPNWDYKFISNTGYRLPEDFQIEKQLWYIAAEKSKGDLAISPFKISERTGVFYVTFSQMIYDNDGNFIGVFGVDFYLKDLIRIFNESYSEHSYAFLVDGDGIILNHPNIDYQMSLENRTDVFDTEYRAAYSSDQSITIDDYTGKSVACLAKKNLDTNFEVVVVNRWWNNLYGNNIIIAIIFILLFGASIAVVMNLINGLIRWQNDVQEQLTSAVDTAVAAGKAKSQFLAQMSHEIRTPINAVLGMNEMILRESQNYEILEYAENIQRAGRILLNLINNILDFSKIEDGKMEIVPTRYETTIMISDIVNMISERARKKNLELKIEIDPSLPKILYGDDVRIRQVIINLLTNAVKYTQEGSVTLSIGGSVIATDRITLYVVVKDTGIGIKKEDMDKLFQSFQRLDEEKNRNIEGTGLGITIVQKLLKMMDSRLEVESVYGEGSTFSFSLDQKIIDTAPIGDYRARTASRKKLEKYLRAPDAKILVVDDNEMNLKVIRGLLKRSGIKPDLVTSGRECLERVKSNRYDIIFLDHMMPGMDGIETLHALQSSGDLPDMTTVIALTANAISGAREQYIKEGFRDYLTKPIEIDLLEQMIAKYLPEGMASFEDPSAPSESKIESKSDEKSDEVFDARERRKFAEVCPEINLDVGLENCTGDREFLFEMMEEFISNDKTSELERLFESKDLKNYQIQTHALKSTSLVIGAVELSDLAKTLELDAKDQILDESKHHELMKKYRETLHHLKLLFGIAEESVDDSFESRIEKICPEIDLDVGLENCTGDREFLFEMMEEFVSNDKTSELERLFESKDLKNYQIQTHALKSTSLVIGAVELSDLAKTLELDTKDQILDESKHHELMKKYRTLLANLKSFLE